LPCIYSELLSIEFLENNEEDLRKIQKTNKKKVMIIKIVYNNNKNKCTYENLVIFSTSSSSQKILLHYDPNDHQATPSINK